MALGNPTPLTYILYMPKRFCTVVQIGQFESRVKGRMTATDIDTVTDMLAGDPLCGDLIQGTGGVRKVRIAVKGKGKNGGVRVVYYYYNETLPLFLLIVFAKNEKDNLTKAERNALAKLVGTLRDSYGV